MAREKVVYSEEQRAEMLAKAEEIGVKAAADAYGVPWQVIAQMKRRAAEAAAGVSAEKKAAQSRSGKKAPKEAKKPAEKKEKEPKAAAKEEENALAAENAILKEKLASWKPKWQN